MAKDMISKESNIREVANLLSNIVASFVLTQYSRLYYWHIEHDKITALNRNQGNLDNSCLLSPPVIKELKWENNNILNSFCVMQHNPEVEYIIYTDASTIA